MYVYENIILNLIFCALGKDLVKFFSFKKYEISQSLLYFSINYEILIHTISFRHREKAVISIPQIFYDFYFMLIALMLRIVM